MWYTWWSSQKCLKIFKKTWDHRKVTKLSDCWKKCNSPRTMNLVLSDFNSLAAVLLTRHSTWSRNIGLQLQSKFVRRRRRRRHRQHYPRVSADYDSSTRERREREREWGRTGGGWGLPINAAAAAATTPDDPDAERRDAGERESPRGAKRECAKRSPLPVYSRNPDTRCALPGDHCARRDARRPLHRAGILAGVRNTHVRPLNFARLS